MTRFTLFASAIAVFCTINCSDDPVDDSAPDIQNPTELNVLLFDTLEVKFNEDLAEFSNETNLIDPNIDCQLKPNNNSILQCYSITSHYSELNLFPKDTTITLEFLNLSDGNGNTAPTSMITFSTTSILDTESDTTPNTNDLATEAMILNDSVTYPTLSEGCFYTGTSVDTGITLNGYLHAGGLTINDVVDWYQIKMRANDSMVFTITGLEAEAAFTLLSTSPDLDIGFTPVILKANQTNTVSFVMPGTHRDQIGTTGTVWERLSYYFKIQLTSTLESKTPYYINIKRAAHTTNVNWPQDTCPN